MSSLMQRLGIDKMSATDRLRLIDEIWESLEQEAEVEPLTETQRSEIDRRLANADANPEAGIPWEQVQANARDRLRRRREGRGGP